LEDIIGHKSKNFDRGFSTPVTVNRFHRESGAWVLDGSGTWGNAGGPTQNVRDYVARAWDTFPGWKAYRASHGYLPTQTMTEDHWSHSQMALAAVTLLSDDGIYKVEMPYFVNAVVDPCIIHPAVDQANAEYLDIQNQAKSKVLAKFRDMKVNAAVALGEGRQTVRMIADMARKLGTAYSAFRRRRFKKAADILGINKPVGSAANHWLEYSYGWSPLLSDCVGLAELAAQHLALGGRPPRLHLESVKKSTITIPNTLAAANQGSTFDVLYDVYIYGNYYMTGSAGLLCELNYTTSALAAQLGFGLTDPLNTAYELIPFSFVFDWFIDVGQMLENMSSLQGWTPLVGFQSYKFDCQSTQTRSNIRIASTHVAHATHGILHFDVRRQFYGRSPWSGSPPSIRAPLWDGLKGRRIITAASLMKQRTSGDRAPGAYSP